MTGLVSFYPLDCQIQNYYSTTTGAQSKYAVPSLAKKNTANTKSIAGNTTLFTTVLICEDASFHVFSTAEATFPVLEAYDIAGHASDNKSMTQNKAVIRFNFISLSTFHSLFCCYLHNGFRHIDCRLCSMYGSQQIGFC